MSNALIRAGGTRTQTSAIPLLTMGRSTNWVHWSKHMLNLNTKQGKANVELRTEVPLLLPEPMRTLTVPDNFIDANGDMQEHMRNWRASDDVNLQRERETWKKDKLILAQQQSETWTTLTDHTSTTTLNAVEALPDWDELVRGINSLQLWLNLKMVCQREILGNAEATRKRWYRHDWQPGDDINEFFNLFEDYCKDILLASGSIYALYDCDKVQRVKDAFPSDVIASAVPEVTPIGQSKDAYPTYAWVKNRLVHHIQTAEDDFELANLNEEAVSPQRRALFIRPGRERERGTHNNTTRTTKRPANPSADQPCTICGSTTHWRNTCPDWKKKSPNTRKKRQLEEEPCDICGKNSHKRIRCYFNPENPDCYKDLPPITDAAPAKKKQYKKKPGSAKAYIATVVNTDGDYMDYEPDDTEEVQSDEEQIPIPGDYLNNVSSYSGGRAYMIYPVYSVPVIPVYVIPVTHYVYWINRTPDADRYPTPIPTPPRTPEASSFRASSFLGPTRF
jgi:hypothetical protein